jgi:hypothetical protein
MIYGVEFRLHNPGNGLWLYRPVFTLITTFVYTWLIFYAAITIKKKHGDNISNSDNKTSDNKIIFCKNKRGLSCLA